MTAPSSSQSTSHVSLEPRTAFRLEEGGYLFLAHSADQLEQLAKNVALQNELDIPSAIIEPEAAAEIVPGLDAGSLVGAAWICRVAASNSIASTKVPPMSTASLSRFA